MATTPTNNKKLSVGCLLSIMCFIFVAITLLEVLLILPALQIVHKADQNMVLKEIKEVRSNVKTF